MKTKGNSNSSDKVEFVKAFYIYKDGVTEDWVKIVYPKGSDYNVSDKRVFYESLGYKVMDGIK